MIFSDEWDLAAVLLLIDECRDKQSLLNSVAGTEKAYQVYKLIAMGMKEQKRLFTWEECKARFASLNATYLTGADFQENQTGAGTCYMHPEIQKALSRYHEGSTAMEAPVAYSFGATNSIKKGTVHNVKVLGMGAKKQKKVWTFDDDPITPKQQALKLEAEKLAARKESNWIQKQAMGLLQGMQKERQERQNSINNG